MFRKLFSLTSRPSKRKRWSPPRARLRLESLEDRVVPSTVTMALAGTLTVNQTAPGHTVTITENKDGSITVTTDDTLSGNSHFFSVLSIRFNDQAAPASAFTEVEFVNKGGPVLPGNVTVNGEGGDTLEVLFEAFNVRGPVTVSDTAATSSLEMEAVNSSFGSLTVMGGGNGSGVALLFTTIRSLANINLGSGGGATEFEGVNVGANLSVSGSGTHDTVTSTALNVAGNTSINISGSSFIVAFSVAVFQGDLSVATGNGSGEVLAEAATVGGNTAISTGNASGGVTVGLVEDTMLHNLSVTSGTANTLLELEVVQVNGITNINMGNASAGAEVVVFASTFNGAVFVTFGSGNDLLSIQSVGGLGSTKFLGGVSANMGGGTDTLAIGESGAVFFALQASFNGGDGNDTASYVASNVSGVPPTFPNFETVNVL
jgi:hypothetical protein